MKRQRRRLKPNLLGDDASRQAFQTVLDQQSKDRQAMLMGESAESGNGLGRIHRSIRYYDDYRNVNRQQVAVPPPQQTA
jgi:hypothetical protein